MLKKILGFVRKVRYNVAKWFIRRYAIIQYEKVCRKADEMNKALMARYYVVQEGQLSLKIMGRSQYREAKKRFMHNSANSIMYLNVSAYYYTPDRFGNCGLSDFEREARKEAWIRHCYSVCL